jgi:Lysylphosphatidylglycerol synthase TM region
VAVVVVLAVPRVRGRVVPGVRSAFQGCGASRVCDANVLSWFGGNVASELLYSLALGATCLAYGVDLTLPKLVFVNMSASVLSSVIPSPGGIGTAEAALAGGLIVVGVDESTAFAIAVTQRLSTFHLPPIWGYVSLRWLSREGYV